MLIYYLLIFSLGAVLASFINASIYRLEKEYNWRDFIFKGSHCESCGKELKWYELVPVISHILQNGKCRKCGMPINVLYPISELFLGTIFFIFFYLNAPIVNYLFLLILFFWGMYDISYQYIPKKMTDIILLSSIVVWFISVLQNFSTERLIPVIVVGVVGAILIIASQVKKAFGLGDIIVLIILGFWLNIQMLLFTLFFAIALGGVVSVILVIYDRSYLKKYIPFLPFFFLGFVFAFVLFDYLLPLFDSMALLW